MASTLSDEELRKKLKLMGEDVGPITPHTRRTYERKYDLLKRRSGSKNVLNALSSDDSEMDQSPTEDVSRRKKRLNHRVQQNALPEKNKQNLSPQQDIFKKPFSRSPVTNKSPGRRHSLNRSFGSSTFEMETSDSDIDSDTLWKSVRTLPTRNHHLLQKPRPDELESSSSRLRKPIQTSTPNGEKSHYINNNYDRTALYKNTILHSDINSISSDKKHLKGGIVNGFAGDTLNQEFQSEKHRGKTTNYSHCISWFLVLAATGLFVILGLFYVSTIHKNQSTTAKTYFESIKCPQNSGSNTEYSKPTNCIPHEYFKTVLTASRELFAILSAVAGEFECNDGRTTRNLTVTETKALLKERIEYCLENLDFDKVFEYTLLLSLENSDWGISISFKSGISKSYTLGMDVKQISALESSHASKSLWCRLKHSICWTLSKLLFVAFGITFLCLSYFIFKFWKKEKDREEKMFFDLVEKVIDFLQDSDENGNGIPVIHIRDVLIPPKERKKKIKLWNKVAFFIEDNESRIQVCSDVISGEEFKVWRWLPSPSADMEAGKYGKVWQGPAFTNSSKGKNHTQYCPTPCLKIRNMFDSEMEYGDDWQINIQDAILEKCEGNEGIIHIAVDSNSNEGCVYVMCNSTKNAGKAYNALHGWWFDGKLVTVKYLRLQRYLEKFPSSKGCTEPLMPSNNKRLSLSAPFFSSVLERS